MRTNWNERLRIAIGAVLLSVALYALMAAPGLVSYQTPYPVTTVEHARMPALHHPPHAGESSHQIGRLLSDPDSTVPLHGVREAGR